MNKEIFVRVLAAVGFVIIFNGCIILINSSVDRRFDVDRNINIYFNRSDSIQVDSTYKKN